MNAPRMWKECITGIGATVFVAALPIVNVIKWCTIDFQYFEQKHLSCLSLSPCSLPSYTSLEGGGWTCLFTLKLYRLLCLYKLGTLYRH